MTDCRTNALILLEIAQIADLPEYKMQAFAVAQMWLTVAALEDARALRADDAKRETSLH
jgi:hypothetical protein